jgi:hypothetical protein
MAKLTVLIDERARLVTAVLAASDWPAIEQGHVPHAVHLHSKQLRQYVRPFHEHPAVTLVNQRLSKGGNPAEFFTSALGCSWPGFVPLELLPNGWQDWPPALVNFAEQTKIAAFWVAYNEPWEDACAGLETIFAQSQIVPFLGQLLGQPVPKNVAVMPTVTYPMLNPVLAETADTLFFILPPAKAWGESPPWPHGEDPGWVVTQTCWHLAGYFLADTLCKIDEMGQSLLLHAAVTLCLENEFDEAEAMAYLVRSKKEHKLPRLPSVVEQMRNYLAGNGRALTETVT